MKLRKKNCRERNLRARVRAVSRAGVLEIRQPGHPRPQNHSTATPAEFWTDAWPTHWANWIFPPLALAGALIAFRNKLRWPTRTWLWLLPLLWLGWQLISATQTVDADLTATTLWQFFGCVACYFIGALVLSREAALRWLLVGVLAAFAFCLVRAVDQRLVEFPQSHQVLLEGGRDGWTNVPLEMLLEMKRSKSSSPPTAWMWRTRCISKNLRRAG
jgi:hypothetical protein